MYSQTNVGLFKSIFILRSTKTINLTPDINVYIEYIFIRIRRRKVFPIYLLSQSFQALNFQDFITKNLSIISYQFLKKHFRNFYYRRPTPILYLILKWTHHFVRYRKMLFVSTFGKSMKIAQRRNPNHNMAYLSMIVPTLYTQPVQQAVM